MYFKRDLWVQILTHTFLLFTIYVSFDYVNFNELMLHILNQWTNVNFKKKKQKQFRTVNCFLEGRWRLLIIKGMWWMLKKFSEHMVNFDMLEGILWKTKLLRGNGE